MELTFKETTKLTRVDMEGAMLTGKRTSKMVAGVGLPLHQKEHLLEIQTQITLEGIILMLKQITRFIYNVRIKTIRSRL